MLTRLRRAYEALYARAPYSAAAGIIGTKALVGDLIAQRADSADQPVDWARACKFTAFCALYVGSFQQLLYNVLFAKLFPGAGARAALYKTAADNLVHVPMVYLPTYYVAKAAFEHKSPRQGLREYRADGWKTVAACWQLWIPGQFLNFYFVPPQYRIAYIAGLGFVWEVMLSYLAPMNSKSAQVETYSTRSV